MKITRTQYRAAYELGIKHHDEKYPISEARAQLISLGVNSSSAVDLVYSTSHMLSGKTFKRTMSQAAASDYLSWIHDERSATEFQNALHALEQHIDYYENLGGPKKSSLRSVLKKHLESQKNIAAMLSFEWLDRSSSGWIDCLPLAWFENEGTRLGEEHEVRNLNNRDMARARCDVTVSGNFAELNYEKHATFNNDKEMYLGVARIHFSDTDRTHISALEWRTAGKTTFKSHTFRTANLQIPDEGEYHPPTDEAPRKPVMLRERPGQAAFRKKLKGAYNHTCCISGCEVSDALEGAHIDAFRSKTSDNLRNGLLLRRDIHALYDRHLIAIEPGTHVIHVTESIRTATGYATLHGKSLRLPSNPTHHPSQSALKRRWVLFVKKTK